MHRGSCGRNDWRNEEGDANQCSLVAGRTTATKTIHQQAKQEWEGSSSQHPNRDPRKPHQGFHLHIGRTADAPVAPSTEHSLKNTTFLLMPPRAPIPVYNANGTRNQGGAITKYTEIHLKIRDHAEQIDLAITELGDRQIFLGHDWLARHNLFVNWKTGKLTFAWCRCRKTPIYTSWHGSQQQVGWRARGREKLFSQ